ncbi:unnamed protein product, partial [Ectocarpus sp. 12 AP-2014]
SPHVHPGCNRLTDIGGLKSLQSQEFSVRSRAMTGSRDERLVLMSPADHYYCDALSSCGPVHLSRSLCDHVGVSICCTEAIVSRPFAVLSRRLLSNDSDECPLRSGICLPTACEMPRSHAGAATASGRGCRLLWHDETQSSDRAKQ